MYLGKTNWNFSLTGCVLKDKILCHEEVEAFRIRPPHHQTLLIEILVQVHDILALFPYQNELAFNKINNFLVANV